MYIYLSIFCKGQTQLQSALMAYSVSFQYTQGAKQPSFETQNHWTSVKL